MKRILTTLVISLSLLLGTASGALAQDFDKGLEAHRKGDYATALREFRLLAEQGSVTAQFNLDLMYDKGKGCLRLLVRNPKWTQTLCGYGEGKELRDSG
jgi:TPR repeat protein